MFRLFFSAFILFSLVSLLSPGAVSASSALVEMIGREGCVHCTDEEAYLRELSDRRGDLEIRIYDAEAPDGKALFDLVTAVEGISKATPITAVGGTIIQGFESEETTGRRIEALLDANPDSGGFEEILTASSDWSVEKEAGSTCETGDVCRMPGGDPVFVSLPFVGAFDVSQYSLPTLAAVLGFVDGFNPCALWVLVTFLLVLIQIGDRMKMFLVAGLFILTEAIMYYLILNIWFSAWDFIGLDRIVTPVVGLLALGGGVFFLYEWKYKGGTCSVTNVGQRAAIASKVKDLATKPVTWVTIGGIILLAFSVNIIEFACSVGIPQAFTKILEINGLEFLPRQGLMLLYTLAYMIDDLIVFGIALAGAAQLGKTQMYAKWCNFFGGILMILLGLLLIFRPEKLLF